MSNLKAAKSLSAVNQANAKLTPKITKWPNERAKIAIGQRIGKRMQGADLETFQELVDLQKLLTADL